MTSHIIDKMKIPMPSSAVDALPIVKIYPTIDIMHINVSAIVNILQPFHNVNNQRFLIDNIK